MALPSKSSRLSQYKPYLAGPKRYGSSGLSNAPTVGPVDPMGYRERDAKVKARQKAIRNRLSSLRSGKARYLQSQPEPFRDLEERTL